MKHAERSPGEANLLIDTQPSESLPKDVEDVFGGIMG